MKSVNLADICWCCNSKTIPVVQRHWNEMNQRWQPTSDIFILTIRLKCSALRSLNAIEARRFQYNRNNKVVLRYAGTYSRLITFAFLIIMSNAILYKWSVNCIETSIHEQLFASSLPHLAEKKTVFHLIGRHLTNICFLDRSKHIPKQWI